MSEDANAPSSVVNRSSVVGKNVPIVPKPGTAGGEGERGERKERE